MSKHPITSPLQADSSQQFDEADHCRLRSENKNVLGVEDVDDSLVCLPKREHSLGYSVGQFVSTLAHAVHPKRARVHFGEHVVKMEPGPVGSRITLVNAVIRTIGVDPVKVDHLLSDHDYQVTALGLGGRKPRKQLSGKMQNQIAALQSKLANVKISKRSKKSPKSDPYSQLSMDIYHFGHAVKDPFSREAEGCRICDSNQFPTATYRLKGTVAFSIPANAVNTFGTAAFLPHPILSMVELSSNQFQAATTTTYTSSTAMNPYTVNTNMYGATTPTLLSGVLANYRIVAWGLKIRCTMPELVRTGRIFFAPIPCSRDIGGYNALNLRSMTNTSPIGTRILGGIPISTANTSTILNLPGAQEISMCDLGLKDLVLISKPNSNSCRTFHTTINGAILNVSESSADTVSYTTATGAILNGDSADLMDASGWSGWIIHFEGLPLTANPLIDVEYVYHLEGTPTLAAAGATTTPVATGHAPAVANTNMFNKAMDFASNLPWASMVDAGLSSLGIASMGNPLATAGNLALNLGYNYFKGNSKKSVPRLKDF